MSMNNKPWVVPYVGLLLPLIALESSSAFGQAQAGCTAENRVVCSSQVEPRPSPNRERRTHRGARGHAKPAQKILYYTDFSLRENEARVYFDEGERFSIKRIKNDNEVECKVGLIYFSNEDSIILDLKIGQNENLYPNGHMISLVLLEVNTYNCKIEIEGIGLHEQD